MSQVVVSVLDGSDFAPELFLSCEHVHKIWSSVQLQMSVYIYIFFIVIVLLPFDFVRTGHYDRIFFFFYFWHPYTNY